MRTQKIALSGAMLCLALSGVAMLSTGCAGDRYQRSTGAYIDDKGITARVKTALFRDPNVSGFDVHVNTFRGDVQLNGFVDTQEQKDHAAAVAQNVEGVRAVTNSLEVKPGPAVTNQAVGTSGATVQGSSSTVSQPAADTVNGPAPIVNPPPAPPPAYIPPAPVVNNRPTTTGSNFAPGNPPPAAYPPAGNPPVVNQNMSDRDVMDSAYRALPNRNNLNISSANGRLTLTGTVKSEDEKLSVARKLLAVPGVVSVDNQLQVVPDATTR